jgi:hypothetical protein
MIRPKLCASPLLFLVALCASGCSKKDAGSSGATSDTTSATAAAAAETPEPPKPPPPADAAKSCTVTFTGKLIDAGGGQQGLEYKIKNTGSHEWHFCQIYTFAYDKSGAQLGRGSNSDNRTLKPGEEQTSGFGIPLRDDKGTVIAPPPGAVYEVLMTHVIFSDRSEWQDKSFSYSEHKTATGPTVALGPAAAASAATAKAPAPKKK